MADIHDLLRAGLTYRQVDTWTTNGYLRPTTANPGSGRQRQYPASEVDVARTMARLAAAGLTVKAAHTVARGERTLAPGVVVLVVPEELVADG